MKTNTRKYQYLAPKHAVKTEARFSIIRQPAIISNFRQQRIIGGKKNIDTLLRRRRIIKSASAISQNRTKQAEAASVPHEN